MVELRVVLKKAIPIINYFAGLAVLGLSGFYLVFADKYSLYDWFGPIFNSLFALIMVGTDHNFSAVLNLCKFLDFFFGRGVFYIYIAMQIDLFKVVYQEGCDMYTEAYCDAHYEDPRQRDSCYDSQDCQDSGFFYSLYGIISFWTYWSIFGLGIFCLVIHFSSRDKQISFDSNYQPFEDSNVDTTVAGKKGGNNGSNNASKMNITNLSDKQDDYTAPNKDNLLQNISINDENEDDYYPAKDTSKN